MPETTTSAALEITTGTPALFAFWDNLTAEFLPVFCWCLTVLLITVVLLCYRYFSYVLKVTKGGLSVPMIFFLGNHLLNSAVFILSKYVVNPLFNALNIASWLNPWWSFWVGNYLLVAPAMVFFVVMDRYLALVLGFKYTSAVRRGLKWTQALCVISLYTFDLFDVLLAWPYSDVCYEPGTEHNPVAVQACLPLLNRIVNFIFQALKVLFPAANFIISILFLWQLSRTKIPNVVTSLYFNLNTYLFLMASLDAAICSIAYTRLLFNFPYVKRRLAPASSHHASTSQMTPLGNITRNRSGSFHTACRNGSMYGE
ncbi:hypothetical protein Ddc_12676 [Ditylenchus destructor]|nr:hypothetical protein Ddc_12676 [Ditylenchus destructor]